MFNLQKKKGNNLQKRNQVFFKDAKCHSSLEQYKSKLQRRRVEAIANRQSMQVYAHCPVFDPPGHAHTKPRAFHDEIPQYTPQGDYNKKNCGKNIVEDVYELESLCIAAGNEN